MERTLELKGNWWIPDKPDKKFLGTLRFDTYTEGELEIIGDFEDVENYKGINIFEIINGFTGTEITLFNCFEKPPSHHYDDKKITRYYVQFVFKGHIFKNFPDITFNSAILELNYLSYWSNINILQTIPDNNNFIKQIEVKHITPITINIESEEIEVALEFHILRKSNDNNKAKVLIEPKTLLRITPSKKLDFFDFLKISLKLENFFTIAIDKPIQIIGFIGLLKDPKNNSDISVEAFFQIQKELIKEGDDTTPDKMPFSLGYLSEKFPVILSNWFTKYPLLEPIIIHYTSIKYLKMYPEHQFLNLIFSLESYHRLKFCKEDKLLPKPQFNNFRELILEKIPDIFKTEKEIEFITNFKNILNYTNKLTLKRRLKRLLEINHNLLDNVIENEEDFITKVVNTRDYRVHQEKSLKKKAVTDLYELHDVNRQLNFLVELCIYNELGFNEKEINEISNRRKRNFTYF